jgi:hypothetical protein
MFTTNHNCSFSVDQLALAGSGGGAGGAPISFGSVGMQTFVEVYNSRVVPLNNILDQLIEHRCQLSNLWHFVWTSWCLCSPVHYPGYSSMLADHNEHIFSNNTLHNCLSGGSGSAASSNPGSGSSVGVIVLIDLVFQHICEWHLDRHLR